MRIGMYHHDLPVPGRKPGGVAAFVHRLAVELVAREHDVTVWSRGPAPTDAAYRSVRLWPRLGQDSKLVRMFLVPALHNEVRWKGVDVLHLNGDDWFMVRRPLPTVRTLHGSSLLELRHATTTKRRLFTATAAVLEYASARQATVCRALGGGVPAIYPTSGTFDVGTARPARLPDRRSDAPTILFVGTWDGRKRGRLLHRIFREAVKPAIRDAELWMVADYVEPADGVVSLGAIDDLRLIDAYQRAWILCHPSTYEGFGIPYIEAMANGAAIVSSDNPGARHVLGQHLGASSIVADAQLGGALVALLGDPAERIRRAEEGRSRSEEFTWGRVVDQHLAVYEEAVARFRISR